MDEQKPFGERLRYARNSHGWSQDTLATKVGCDTRSVMRWETGKSRPREDSLLRLCELFGKSVEEWGLLDEVEVDVDNTPEIPLLPVYREEMEEAPSTLGFRGRESECQQLTRWVVEERSRLVALLGMGGMGKTTLAARIVELVKEDFVCVFWRSLKNAPPLAELLRQCLPFLSPQQEPPLSGTIAEQLTFLVRVLREQRCLLVLDNLESLLQPGERAGLYRPGYEDYGDLFRRLGEVSHSSCLLLTSREKPAELAHLEGQVAGVRSLRLDGLSDNAARALLEERALQGSDEQWAALVQRYTGNPLALKLVAFSIHSFFGTQIDKFLQAEEFIFGDINVLLDQQFQRLTSQERELLYWLAIEREALTLDAIREKLVTARGDSLLGVLESLERRSLLEMREQRFFLQPVILEYVSDELVLRACAEFLDFSRRPLNSFGSIPPIWQRFAFIRAMASDYLRETQVRLLLAPLAEQLVSELGRLRLLHQCNHLLEEQRQVEVPGSYLAGNVLNLLLHLRGDLRGRDFSDLTIRQAYLQNVQLPATNFTRAHFRETVFTNTFGAVLSVAFHPAGHLLAAGTANGDIWLFRVADGAPMHIYRGHIDGVWALSFSPDGTLLASGSDDWTACVWDVVSGARMLCLQGHRDRVRALAFSPDGTFLVSGSNDASIHLWETQSGQLLRRLQGHTNAVWSLAFHPAGGILASGSADQNIRLWDLAQDDEHVCQATLQGHSNRVRSVAFHPAGRLLASASDDWMVRIWDIEERACLHILQGHSNRVWSVAFSSDGEHLASGSEDSSVRLWDYTEARCLKTLQGHDRGVRSVTFSPDCTFLASVSDDQTVRLWENRTGSALKTFQGYTNRVWSVAFAPVSGLLASASENQEIRFWNAHTGLCERIVPTLRQGILSIAANPVLPQLASVGGDQNLHLWQTQTGQHQRVLQGHSNWVRAVAFSKDGKHVASGGEDNLLILWDAQNGQKRYMLTGHTNGIRAVAFSADGTLLASGGDDRVLRLWDTKTGVCLRSIDGLSHALRALVFHPQKMQLFSASEDGVIRAWDAATGECTHSYLGHTNRVIGIDIDVSGDHLVSCGDDLSLRLWDLANGSVRVIELAHTNRIRAVVYSPDGLLVASCGDDGAIKIWDSATLICLHVLLSERPYERMNILGATGLTEVQRAALATLGAIEE